jgi:hypothetical protein
MLVVALACPPASAGCWSILKSPKWDDVRQSLDKAKLCEVLPVGPNRTSKFSISQFDVCDAPGGLRLHVEASLDCKSGGNALIRTKAKASVKADVAVDIGTCTVTESKLEFGGAAGELLAGQPDLQNVARRIAQAKLSELCGK